MMRLVEFLYAAASGVFVTLTVVFVVTDVSDPWWVAFGVIGFGMSIALLLMQPTNVSGAMIVQVSALKVFTFVNGRPVEWCGDHYLHDMHVRVHTTSPDKGHAECVTQEVVCLGHKCHCPESHMEKVGKE